MAAELTRTLTNSTWQRALIFELISLFLLDVTLVFNRPYKYCICTLTSHLSRTHDPSVPTLIQSGRARSRRLGRGRWGGGGQYGSSCCMTSQRDVMQRRDARPHSTVELPQPARRVSTKLILLNTYVENINSLVARLVLYNNKENTDGEVRFLFEVLFCRALFLRLD